MNVCFDRVLNESIDHVFGGVVSTGQSLPTVISTKSDSSKRVKQVPSTSKW